MVIIGDHTDQSLAVTVTGSDANQFKNRYILLGKQIKKYIKSMFE